MYITDPGMYVDKDYRVTTLYRKLENVMLEDNCSEGIWMEQLEKPQSSHPAGGSVNACDDRSQSATQIFFFMRHLRATVAHSIAPRIAPRAAPAEWPAARRRWRNHRRSD